LITATLTLEGQALAQRHARTHLALLVPLDPPVSLLGNPTTADAPLRQCGALTRWGPRPGEGSGARSTA
jgi:hypothetical protein